MQCEEEGKLLRWSLTSLLSREYLAKFSIGEENGQT